MVTLNKKYLNNFINEEELMEMKEQTILAQNKLVQKTGSGNDFLDWLELPTKYDKEEFNKIKETANKIQQDSKVLIVIGIGGSYLGAKAVIDMLTYGYSNKKNDLEIYFAGQNISSEHLIDIKKTIGDKDFSINVISKSGTTTEPAIAFRYFKKILFEKYGEKANERIYATTDASKGALYSQAKANNWESFVVPDAVGGRFSVLTAVGLLPIAAAGIDIDMLMQGAKEAQNKYNSKKYEENDALQYAAIRNVLYNKGKNIEMLIGYEPKMQFFNEWWKQLYGESEGKDNKGIFPASAIYSTDLHSLGQYVQEGQRNLFETVIFINNVNEDILIEAEEEDLDGLNYLTGKTVSYVNSKAYEATAEAHVEGGVPNIVIEVESLDEKSIGEIIYLFEYACGVSGYMLGVNPFNQPGVESYKNKMFTLLEKPGY